MDRIDDCISFLSGKAAQAVARLTRDRLSNHGVTPVQYAVLQVLLERDGQSAADIGSRLVLDSATITGVLDRIEKLGLIARGADTDDRRVNRITLTPAGRARQASLQPIMDAINAEVAERLGADAPELWRLLRRLAAIPTAGKEP